MGGVKKGRINRGVSRAFHRGKEGPSVRLALRVTVVVTFVCGKEEAQVEGCFGGWGGWVAGESGGGKMEEKRGGSREGSPRTSGRGQWFGPGAGGGFSGFRGAREGEKRLRAD